MNFPQSTWSGLTILCTGRNQFHVYLSSYMDTAMYLEVAIVSFVSLVCSNFSSNIFQSSMLLYATNSDYATWIHIVKYVSLCNHLKMDDYCRKSCPTKLSYIVTMCRRIIQIWIWPFSICICAKESWFDNNYDLYDYHILTVSFNVSAVDKIFTYSCDTDKTSPYFKLTIHHKHPYLQRQHSKA